MLSPEVGFGSVMFCWVLFVWQIKGTLFWMEGQVVDGLEKFVLENCVDDLTVKGCVDVVSEFEEEGLKQDELR